MTAMREMKMSAVQESDRNERDEGFKMEWGRGNDDDSKEKKKIDGVQD